MKKLLFVCVSFLGMSAYVSAQKIEFKQLEINYGKIAHGADGAREFEFTNTGTAPLIISAAQGSCGCTVPEYPKEPIMPGAKSVIKVKYDTQRTGGFTKYVTLTSNSTDNPSTRLTISGEVLPQGEAAPVTAATPAPPVAPAPPAPTTAKKERPVKKPSMPKPPKPNRPSPKKESTLEK
jgi:hypothetical protein